MNASTDSLSDLKTRWNQFRHANPRTRIRDAAAALGTTEAELLATRLGEGVVRLAVDGRDDGWGAVILRLPSLGRVMALTRNAHCVHERRGIYREIGLFGPMGNVVGPDIDLRFFLNRWVFGFAVTDEGKDEKARHSLVQSRALCPSAKTGSGSMSSTPSSICISCTTRWPAPGSCGS